jgi:2-polyprenyl-6-methoxyphenol hydroxylase-like FAD-dependent oxidoreductase
VSGPSTRRVESDPGEIEEPSRRTPVTHRADVLVVGGGSAGVAAATAAARNGADVLLVERYGYLGGLATGGLILLLLTLDDGRGRQAIAGLCQELTERLVARGAAHAPPRSLWGSDESEAVEEARRWGLVWKLALDAMVRESGARVLFHAWACEPILESDRVVAVAFQGKSGRFAVRADVVIDATGDGDLFAAAGCAHEREKVLPWLWYVAGGFDDVERARAAGAAGFQTIGPGRLLFPWGATEKISRRIDATSPEDLSYAAATGRSTRSPTAACCHARRRTCWWPGAASPSTTASTTRPRRSRPVWRPARPRGLRRHWPSRPGSSQPRSRYRRCEHVCSREARSSHSGRVGTLVKKFSFAR